MTQKSNNNNVGLPLDHEDQSSDLEARVHDLETKLAVLSRLLQKSTTTTEPPVKKINSLDNLFIDPAKERKSQQPSLPETKNEPYYSNYNNTTGGSRAPMPTLTEVLSPPTTLANGMTTDNSIEVPDLRSIPKKHHAKRNLSFRLLYGGDEDQYQQEKLASNAPPITSSMTFSERQWLQPLIHQFQQNHKRSMSTLERTAAAATLEQEQQYDGLRNKWLNYLNSFQESASNADDQMAEFVKVPAQMEVCMMYGFMICLDSYLYMITILPIRFVWSCLLLIIRLAWKKPQRPYQFHRQHSYQLVQVTILVFIYRFVLYNISIGKFYHWIRGQAMIKLYVIIAIIEVFDRLMSGLGQDCLESMYWNTVNRPRSSRMVTSIVLVLFYATCHTLILFLHVETLNVAMNSDDQALLSLFILGNFAEIKSTVFKKYNKAALLKITASDICERFKLGLFLGLVLLVNLCQGMDRSQMLAYGRLCAIIWGSELLADAIKHSFITKFNFLPAKVYTEYSLLLAGDFTGIGHEGVNLDNSHAVVKRLAFSQIPLVVCMLRLIKEAVKYAYLNGICNNCSRATVIGMSISLWLALVICKLALGTYLQRISLIKLQNAPEVAYTPSTKKKN